MRIMRKFGIFCLVLMVAVSSQAQEDNLKKEAVRYPLNVTYFGDNYGLSPGVRLGVENPLRQKIVIINNSNLPDPSRMLFHTLNVAAIYQNGEEWNYFLNAEVGYRFIASSGIYHEYLLGAGVLATQPITDDPGETQEMQYAGEGHASIGLGWDFHKWVESNPLGIFVRATAMIEYPVAADYALHYIAEAGIKIRLKKPKGVKTKYTFR